MGTQAVLRQLRAGNTSVIVSGGVDVGCIAVRPEPDAQWIEHFYLDPRTQGQGMGGAVLREIVQRHRDDRPVRLAIDRGSRVRPLYERHGFTYCYDDANGIDQVFELAAPAPPSIGPAARRPSTAEACPPATPGVGAGLTSWTASISPRWRLACRRATGSGGDVWLTPGCDDGRPPRWAARAGADLGR